MTTAQTAQLRVETHGEVPPWAIGVAKEKVMSALSTAAEPILSARVMLAVSPDPAVACPVVAQATVDMNGRVIRAQAAGRTAREAIGHLGTRLRVRLGRAARNWAAVRGTTTRTASTASTVRRGTGASTGTARRTSRDPRNSAW